TVIKGVFGVPCLSEFKMKNIDMVYPSVSLLDNVTHTHTHTHTHLYFSSFTDASHLPLHVLESTHRSTRVRANTHAHTCWLHDNATDATALNGSVVTQHTEKYVHKYKCSSPSDNSTTKQ